jgi:hypothetical protein
MSPAVYFRAYGGVRAARTCPSHRDKEVARGTPVKADSLRE